MSKRVEITVAKDTSVVDLMADVDVVFMHMPDVESLDLVDLIKIVLRDCKNQASFAPGKYNVRLMAVVTEEHEDESA
jgi:hypothetical protein